jgi:hypothetical protein
MESATAVIRHRYWGNIAVQAPAWELEVLVGADEPLALASLAGREFELCGSVRELAQAAPLRTVLTIHPWDVVDILPIVEAEATA